MTINTKVDDAADRLAVEICNGGRRLGEVRTMARVFAKVIIEECLAEVTTRALDQAPVPKRDNFAGRPCRCCKHFPKYGKVTACHDCGYGNLAGTANNFTPQDPPAEDGPKFKIGDVVRTNNSPDYEGLHKVVPRPVLSQVVEPWVISKMHADSPAWARGCTLTLVPDAEIEICESKDKTLRIWLEREGQTVLAKLLYCDERWKSLEEITKWGVINWNIIHAAISDRYHEQDYFNPSEFEDLCADIRKAVLPNICSECGREKE